MNWNYISGFTDGEGSLCIYYTNPRKYRRGGFQLRPQISIANTNKNILIEMQKYINNFGITSYIQSRRRKSLKHKTGYTLVISNIPGCYLFTSAVNLKIKRRHQKLFKRFLALRFDKLLINNWRRDICLYDKKELSLYAQLKEVNKRGNSSAL